MRYPISAARLELMAKLLVVAFELDQQQEGQKAAARKERRPKHAPRPEALACGR